MFLGRSRGGSEGSHDLVVHVWPGFFRLRSCSQLRRSAAFSRATAAWALAAGVLMLVPSSFGTVGMVLALASLVPWSVLCVMAGRRLLGLAGCRLGIGRRDLPGPR